MKTKDICAVCAILTFVLLFFTFTGTVKSGYHFIDDHEILLISNHLSQEPIVHVYVKIIKKDLKKRFRPMYYLHRVLQVKIFGKNLTAWAIYTVLLLLITLVCFYAGLRKLDFSILETISFLTLAFVGPQMAIWWRLGPNETIGMFFLGFAFYFMVSCQKRYRLNTFLFVLFLVLASLCKESFAIIIPAFLLFKVWHEMQLYRWSLKTAIFKNMLLIIPLFVMSIEILIIIFVIGTNKIGYAGVYGSIPSVLKGIFSIIKSKFKQFIVILGFFLAAIFFELKDEKKFMNFSKKLIMSFSFCLLIIIPNLILYAKSGMFERYLLPSLLGFSFLIVSLIKETRLKFPWLSLLFLAVIFVFSIKPSINAFSEGRKFSIAGNHTKMILSHISGCFQSSPRVLMVANPVKNFEISASIDRYLSIEKGKKIYAYSIEDKNSWGKLAGVGESLTEVWRSWFNNRMFPDMKGEPGSIIFINKDLAERFFNESGLKKENYHNILMNDNRYAIFKENSKDGYQEEN